MRFSTFILLSCMMLSNVVLTACGFTSLYGANSISQGQAIKNNLNDIAIDIIPDREGQFLRNALIDRFYYSGYPNTPIYQLSLTPIKENVADFDVTINSEATRRQLRLTTKMQFLDAATTDVLLTRTLNAVTSYNVLESEYSTIVTEQSARESALNDLARQIEQQISLYLKR